MVTQDDLSVIGFGGLCPPPGCQCHVRDTNDYWNSRLRGCSPDDCLNFLLSLAPII